MSFVTELMTTRSKKLSVDEKKKAEELIKEHRKADDKIVSGVFKNLEAPGCAVRFSLRLYPGTPIYNYILEDGEKYDLPIGVAKHINNTAVHKQHRHILDSKGKAVVAIGKPRQRYQFLSTDFM